MAAFEVTQHMGTVFRHFRLHQHGLNASGFHHLACVGLELYGTLLDGATSERAVASGVSFARPLVLTIWLVPSPPPVVFVTLRPATFRVHCSWWFPH